MRPVIGITLVSAMLATPSLSHAGNHVKHILRDSAAISASLRPRATQARWTILPGKRGPYQLTAQTGRNDVRVLADVKDGRGRVVPVTEKKFNATPGSALNPGYVAYTGYELDKKSGPYQIRLRFTTAQGKPLPPAARQGITYWISTQAHP